MAVGPRDLEDDKAITLGCPHYPESHFKVTRAKASERVLELMACWGLRLSFAF